MEAAIVITAVVIVLALITKLIQRKLIDRKKMLRLQAEMKKDNKKFSELLKGGNKDNKELETLQAKIMQQQTELMSMNMKQSMFTLPAFLIAFWFLGTLYGGKSLVSFFPLPTFTGFGIFNPASWIPTGLSEMTGYYKMYIFYYLIVNIVLSLVEKVYDTWKNNKAKNNIEIKTESREEKKEDSGKEQKVESK